MNRRQWLQAAGGIGTGAMIGNLGELRAFAGPAGISKWETTLQRLQLRHTWTTTMSSSQYRDTIFVRVTSDGVTGVGEGAPIVRYHENAEDGAKAIAEIVPALQHANLWQFEKLMHQISQSVDGQFAAKAALDVALMDWIGQRMNVPLYRLCGLDPWDAPVTTFSIGIDTPEITKQKVKDAEAFPVLKIKVGLDTDEATIEAVRSVTKKPLRVDANEG